MDRFVDAGITTFDCADIYTGVEALIGEWLKRRGARGGGQPVQVHTKYVPDLDRLSTHSRADVARGIDRSLARLGVECLDLVQLHWWDYDVPGYVEAAAWLDELRRAGKIRHVGLTNFDRPRLGEIIAAGIPIVAHQVQYSVLDRRPAEGMAALCADRGIGLLCYGALAGGFLSSYYLGRSAPTPAARKSIAGEVPADHRRVRRMGPLSGPAGGSGRGGHPPRRGDRRGGAPMGARSTGRVRRHRGGASRATSPTRRSRAPGWCSTPVTARKSRGCKPTSSGPSGEVYELERVKGGPHASVMQYTLNRGPGEAGRV